MIKRDKDVFIGQPIILLERDGTKRSGGITVVNDDEIKITIPLHPYTKKNSSEIHYKHAGGKRIPFVAPSGQYKKYAAECGFFLKPLNITSPVNIKTEFYMGTRRRVDLTNLNEAIHDILVENGVLSDDNALILVSTDGSRVYYDKKNPRTEIIITPADLTFEINAPKKGKNHSSRNTRA